ncbi:MAG: hypothetical protein ACLRFI_03680 [Alphaproteobacteria bacterium]
MFVNFDDFVHKIDKKKQAVCRLTTENLKNFRKFLSPGQQFVYKLNKNMKTVLSDGFIVYSRDNSDCMFLQFWGQNIIYDYVSAEENITKLVRLTPQKKKYYKFCLLGMLSTDSVDEQTYGEWHDLKQEFDEPVREMGFKPDNTRTLKDVMDGFYKKDIKPGFVIKKQQDTESAAQESMPATGRVVVNGFGGEKK